MLRERGAQQRQGAVGVWMTGQQQVGGPPHQAPACLERVIGGFPMEDQQGVRNRLSRAFRYIVSQRLLPRADGNGRVAVIEILKSTLRTREYVEKGESEAKAMNVKAEAYQEYNQAAVIDKLFTSLPEIVRALASPLANVDKITVVSTGNGDAAGLNKITGDITKMAAQVPALFETLSGMSMTDLLSKVRIIGDRAVKPDVLPPAAPAE